MVNTQLADDVRMRGFKQRAPVDIAYEWLASQSLALAVESVSLIAAAGRVLAEDVVSRFNIPGFERSMMDGYAVVAADAQGASGYNQLELRIIGQSMPGVGSEARVISGTTVSIMTGAPLPEGADAVLPAENVEVDGGSVFVMESVAEGRNIGRVGEDVKIGETILNTGRRLRPQDVALMASVGVETVKVYRQPRVNIIVTGNEILPPGEVPQGYQIINSNGPMLAALAGRDGAVVQTMRIVADDENQIRAAMQEPCDILLMTGGTSVGKEDFTPMALAELGELAIHGITMRPSRSTGMGKIGSTVVFLLSGNPVACLCAYDFFGGRFIRQISGRGLDWPYPRQKLALRKKINSMIGRTDYARVKKVDDGIEPLAISGAGILSSTTQADGFVIVPADSEGYPPGTEVDVFMYDQDY